MNDIGVPDACTAERRSHGCTRARIPADHTPSTGKKSCSPSKNQGCIGFSTRFGAIVSLRQETFLNRTEGLFGNTGLSVLPSFKILINKCVNPIC